MTSTLGAVRVLSLVAKFPPAWPSPGVDHVVGRGNTPDSRPRRQRWPGHGQVGLAAPRLSRKRIGRFSSMNRSVARSSTSAVEVAGTGSQVAAPRNGNRANARAPAPVDRGRACSPPPGPGTRLAPLLLWLPGQGGEALGRAVSPNTRGRPSAVREWSRPASFHSGRGRTSLHVPRCPAGTWVSSGTTDRAVLAAKALWLLPGRSQPRRSVTDGVVPPPPAHGSR